MSESSDPVVERRAMFARRANLARRIGYTMWLIAVIIFFYAFATDFTAIRAQAVLVLLVLGSVLLLPAIIIGYGVKAAARDEAKAARAQATRS